MNISWREFKYRIKCITKYMLVKRTKILFVFSIVDIASWCSRIIFNLPDIFHIGCTTQYEQNVYILHYFRLFKCLLMTNVLKLNSLNNLLQRSITRVNSYGMCRAVERETRASNTNTVKTPLFFTTYHSLSCGRSPTRCNSWW